MRLRRLYSECFEPFGELDLHFPEVENAHRGAEVHILTGVNGTGKTRILAVLAAIFGNQEPLIQRTDPEQQPLFFELDEYAGEWSRDHRFPKPDASLKEPFFSLGRTANGVQWGNRPNVSDTIPAYAYSGEAYLTTTAIKGSMEAVSPPPRTIALAFQKPLDSSSQSLSQALYNLTIMGANDIRTHDSLEVAKEKSRPLRLLTRIEAMLGRLTGRRVSFEPVPIPTTRLMVRWGGRHALPFDQLPDGLRSVLGWLVELAVMMDLHHPEDAEPWKKPLAVLLDEVERHLHPAWQRQVLPIAQEMFPNAQFFVATHSPFIISSLNEGWIHHLNLQADGRVTADPPIPAAEGDSYVSVMGSIMGVPELYDPETEGMLANYRELRSAAMKHVAGSRDAAVNLAETIAGRGPELAYMMAREKVQLDKLLNGSR